MTKFTEWATCDICASINMCMETGPDEHICYVCESAPRREAEVEILRKNSSRYLFLRNVADPSDWEYLSYQDEEVMDKQIDWEIEQRTE